MLIACYALPVPAEAPPNHKGEGLHRQAREAAPRPRILARSQRNISRGWPSAV